MASVEWLSNPAAGIARSVRPGQVTMARIVEETLLREQGQIVFLEAGTGTGKSFAYLIPALLSGKRVVISTAKKALQNQLVEKDLPFLCGKIKETSYALLKGKNNYACTLRFKELVTNDAYKRLPQYERTMVEEWMETSVYNDLSELIPPFTLDGQIRVAECVRKSCPHAENACGYVDARDKALGAQIVVVNHALLAYDLSLGGGKILGKYDALVIDDVHDLQGKEQTQDELFHFMNELMAKGGQIVLTSDRPPQALRGLSDRLRSRFEGGLVAPLVSWRTPASASAVIPTPVGAGAILPVRADEAVIRDPEKMVWTWTDPGARLIEDYR